jgi:hypothetical protein
MARLFTLLLFIFLHSFIIAQDKILLSEDFKNNKKEWKLQRDKNFLVEINKGVLHLEKFEKNFTSRGCLWYSRPIPGFNALNDFSITMYARFISGGDVVDVIDMQWGSWERKDGHIVSGLYQLNLMPARGEVKLDHFKSGWTYFVRKDIRKLIQEIKFKPNEINRYDLEQKDGFVYFSVNGTLLLKQLCKPVEGNGIGFQGCLKSVLEIDKIIVRQQNITKAVTVDSAQITANINKNEINYPADKELKIFPNPFTDNLSIKLFLDQAETVQVSLVDINGAVLQQHTRELQKGVQTIRLYADVNPGSYIVRISVGKSKLLSGAVIKL